MNRFSCLLLAIKVMLAVVQRCETSPQDVRQQDLALEGNESSLNWSLSPLYASLLLEGHTPASAIFSAFAALLSRHNGV